MDKRFVKVIDDGAAIENAPATLRTEEKFISNPTEADYNAAGFYELDETVPEVEPGFRISWGKYVEADNKVVRTYVIKPEVDEWVEPEYEYRIISDTWEEREDCFYRVVVTKRIVNVGKDEPCPEGFHYEVEREEEDDETITVYWVKVADPVPPPPPTIAYSKLKLEVALFHLGLLGKFETFLTENSITNEMGETRSLKEFYATANDLETGNAYFEEYKAKAIEALGISAEEAEAILAQCVAE